MTRLALVVALLLSSCRRSSDEARPCPEPTPATTTVPVLAAAPVAKPPRMPVPATVAGVAPIEGDFVLRDFAFTSGDKLAELRIHYTTLGTPKRDAAGRVTNAVLIMHGTGGSGLQFTRKQFADVLFGPGQPLDLSRYYVILPDDIGHGRSSRPSDGLATKFPRYGYVDMVTAEHALVRDGLGIERLRLVMGTSMGCMHAWMWAARWPDMMDAVMPLACLPVAITGRNRQWRKLVIDAIRSDPAWAGGNYTTQPRAALQTVAALWLIVGSSPLADHKRLPTRESADKEAEDKVAAFMAANDANDLLYAVSASHDYDPSLDLDKITAPVVFVNSADDFVNPPELAIAEREIKRVKRGRFILIPASESTHGHGTHTWAEFWQHQLAELLAATAR